MSSEIDKRKYTREEYIYLSKLYTKAEEYKKVLEFIEEFIKLNPKLDKEELDILSTGFKNMITDKRASWFTLNSLERKEKKKKKNIVKEIKEVKSHIENELRETCNKLQEIVDKYLLPNNDDDESVVFLYKLKADYFRYICEFAEGKELENNLTKSEEYYKKAFEISEKKLPIMNCNRVSVGLNYAIFLYEVKKDKKGGFDVAQNIFKESMKFIDDLENSKYRDTLLIIQLLKENIIFWNSEMSEEEAKLPE
jgi:14-3-3 protein epsilon